GEVGGKGFERVLSEIDGSDAIILSMGTNDFWKDTHTMTVIDNHRAASGLRKTRLAERGQPLPVIYSTTVLNGIEPRYAKWLGGMNVLFRKTPWNRGPIRFDRIRPVSLREDGVHPNAEGYE